jgi:hypothetical protein
MAASENSTRRSGRRRRRSDRRPGKRKEQTATASEKQTPSQKQGALVPPEKQELPEVFIYTYTIYKAVN